MGKPKVNLYTIPDAANQERRIEETLRLLGLEGTRASFEKLAQKSIKDHGTFYDFLEALLEKEIVWKEENRVQRWIQQARFPWKKTLEDFDFSFQPSLDRRLISELASCRFVGKAENVVFLGPSGVGKTHLSISLGLEAIYKGHETRFSTLGQMIESVDKVTDGETLRRVFSSFLRPKLLILDEMDFYETSPTTAIFLFKLLYQRYEKGSVIFTSNKTFAEWGKLFGNSSRAGAIIDRITHRCHIVKIEGDSYRFQEKLKQSS